MAALVARVPVLNSEDGRVYIPGQAFEVADAAYAEDLASRGLASIVEETSAPEEGAPEEEEASAPEEGAPEEEEASAPAKKAPARRKKAE